PAVGLLTRRSRGADASWSAEASAVAAPLVEQMAAGWRAGRRPLAEEFLDRNPALRDHVEVALRLVYEEGCLREEVGEPVAPRRTLERSPRWKDELGVLLDCHRILGPEATAPDFPRAGEEIGGFSLLAELGRGALGRVFLASQPDLADRPVVVKVTPI